MTQTSSIPSTDQPWEKLHNNLIKYIIKNPVQQKMQEIPWDRWNVHVDVFKECNHSEKAQSKQVQKIMNQTIYAAGRLHVVKRLEGHSPESPPPSTFISLERNLRAPVFQDIHWKCRWGRELERCIREPTSRTVFILGLKESKTGALARQLHAKTGGTFCSPRHLSAVRSQNGGSILGFRAWYIDLVIRKNY